jgi:hypothetical protein
MFKYLISLKFKMDVDSLREKLEKKRIEENLKELHKLRGSAKNPKILSKKELNRLIMKEYGI